MRVHSYPPQYQGSDGHLSHHRAEVASEVACMKGSWQAAAEKHDHTLLHLSAVVLTLHL